MNSTLLKLSFSAALLATTIGFLSFRKIAAYRPDADQGAPVIFWSNNNRHGKIDVYVDNVYKGSITRFYNGVPQCASPGCVTVVLYGQNYFRAEAQDGTTWNARHKEDLAPNVCNSECLR